MNPVNEDESAKRSHAQARKAEGSVAIGGPSNYPNIDGLRPYTPPAMQTLDIPTLATALSNLLWPSSPLKPIIDKLAAGTLTPTDLWPLTAWQELTGKLARDFLAEDDLPSAVRDYAARLRGLLAGLSPEQIERDLGPQPKIQNEGVVAPEVGVPMEPGENVYVVAVGSGAPDRAVRYINKQLGDRGLQCLVLASDAADVAVYKIPKANAEIAEAVAMAQRAGDEVATFLPAMRQLYGLPLDAPVTEVYAAALLAQQKGSK